MSAASWILWAVAAAAGFGSAIWLYRRLETPGKGRGALAALRGATVALLLLLAFDPDLPGAAVAAGGRAVLIDQSLSMRLAGPDGATRWETAVSRARATTSGDVTLFGAAPRSLAIDSIATINPSTTTSRLLPALQAVAEAGRRQVTVITDGAIADADEVARWLPRLGIELTVIDITGDAANRALTRVSAPPWVQAGEPVDLEFDLAASGSVTGPVSIVVRESGRELARTIVETPAQGRLATGSVSFVATPSQLSEYIRYDVSIEGGDAIPDDDGRPVYIHVTAEPAGAVLISFAPDWEPRFLQPVLQRSLGMPIRGYLRSGDGWLMLGAGVSVGARASDADVRRAVDRAELLVLHAFGSASPEWARTAAAEANRLMVLPTGDGVVPGLPLPPTVAVAGDWYVAEDVPPSPVAAMMAGMDVGDVPPLGALRLPGVIAGTWAPATVSRARRGAPYPLALSGQTGSRRWVVALGEGYWRWAFWSDAARGVYERLWSALAGWVVGDAVAAGPDAAAPARRIVERGAPPIWVTYGGAPDSVAVRLVNADGAVATDTVIAGTLADTVATAAIVPGIYDYEVRAWSATGTVSGTGQIAVESYSDEFTRTAGATPDLESAPVALGPGSRSRTPLHSRMWPFAGLILLLCLEWILRRRWGLR